MKIANPVCVVILVLACAQFAGAADAGYSRFSKQRDLMREGERLENIGRYKRAAKAYRKSGLYAIDNRTRGTLLAREADCYVNGGKPYDAFAAYERLLESYPLYVEYEKVMPRLRLLAGQFERGDNALFGMGNKTKAIKVYELILQETPLGQGAMQDSINLGNLLVEVERGPEAVEIYRDALRRFPRDEKAPGVRLALGRLLVDESRNGDGDGQIARQATRELQSFVEERPDDPARKDADFLLNLVAERQAETLFDLGEFYLRPAHRREPAARRYLNDAVRDYPNTAAAARADLLLAALGPPTPEVEEAIALPPPPVATPMPPLEEEEILTKVRLRKPAKPATRVLEGVFPGAGSAEGEGRSLPPLEERENVEKWLLPLDDANGSSPGGTK